MVQSPNFDTLKILWFKQIRFKGKTPTLTKFKFLIKNWYQQFFDIWAMSKNTVNEHCKNFTFSNSDLVELAWWPKMTTENTKLIKMSDQILLKVTESIIHLE